MHAVQPSVTTPPRHDANTARDYRNRLLSDKVYAQSGTAVSCRSTLDRRHLGT
jgi:hypothetical protein